MSDTSRSTDTDSRENNFRGRVWQRILLVLIGVFALGPPVAAQPKSSLGGQSVVDVVTLKSGRSLRGMIARTLPNGSLTMVVAHDWLKNTHQPIAAATLKGNLEEQTAGWIQTRDRIVERQMRSEAPPHLAFFLKQERERLDRLITDPSVPEPDFLWLDIPFATIAKVIRTTPDRQRIGWFAWNERLNKVETLDATTLRKELTDRGTNLDGPPVELIEKLPARLQTDDEWSVRMALVEDALNKPIHFQGIGDTLTRTREGQPANLTELLPKLLQQQLSSLLKEIASDFPPTIKSQNDDSWLGSAIRQVEMEKGSGFRVTRVAIDATSSRATVESRFVAFAADGKWKTIWQSQQSGDGTLKRPQAEAQIEQDPQLKSALDALKSFDLVDAEALKKAVRVGAATTAAQHASDEAFAEFRDRYLRRLDGPPLWIPTAQ